MNDFPEPTTFNGYDRREFGGGKPKTPTQLFWRAYDYAVRHDLVNEFLAIYRPMPVFWPLVAEIVELEAMRIKEREQ